jgi:hypothetical protein
MSETFLSVGISESLYQEASQQARRAGVSLEQWLLAVAAERVRDEQVADRFFRHRVSQETAGQMMREILDNIPDNPPDPGDELPEGYGHSLQPTPSPPSQSTNP